MIKLDQLSKAIHDHLKDINSDKLIIQALFSLAPSKRRIILLLILFLFFMSLYHFLFHIEDPINSSIEIFKTVNVVVLPVLALAVTGYAIFQALVSGKTLITLLEVEQGEYSKFKAYNFFFLSFSVLSLFMVILNFILLILFNNISSTWSLDFLDPETNYVLFTILICVYITFLVNLLIEVKCFLYNLYQIFVINAVAKGIEHIEEHSNSDKE